MDFREQFIQSLAVELSGLISHDDLTKVTDTATKLLSSYEISERKTDLVPYENKNERILKRYAACLSVDGKSKKTIDLYIRRLTVFSDFVGIPFDEVGPYDVRFYLASAKEQGCSNRTLENYRSYIASFFQWMTREDFIPKNPCEKIQPIKYKEEIRIPFSDTEIDLMRSACGNERDRAMMELLLSSGIRVTELINLDITDVDFNDLSIHIREGKGSKERHSYITPVCAMHLKTYLMQRLDDGPALFLSLKRKERMTTSGIRKILKEIEKKSKVRDVHPHRFRRTFATNLAKRGMDVQTIARLMGHSSIQTTMIYVTLDDSRVISEYKKHTA